MGIRIFPGERSMTTCLNRTVCLAVALSLAGLVMADAQRSNWPQWRGPNLDGSAPNAHDLAVTWSPTENVLWRTKLPSWSAAIPAVWGDRVFMVSAEEGFARLGSDGAYRGGSAAAGHDRIFLI